MLNRWFKLIEMTPFSVDSSITNTRMASTASTSGCDQPTASNANDIWDTGINDDTDFNQTTINATPSMMPFRKKAITSIERTRKLSILLKHQRYLVSGNYKLISFKEWNCLLCSSDQKCKNIVAFDASKNIKYAMFNWSPIEWFLVRLQFCEYSIRGKFVLFHKIVCHFVIQIVFS